MTGSDSSINTGTRSGMLWSVAGAGGQSVLNLVVLIVLARILPPADFGLAAAAMVICGLGIVFSKLGIGQSIVQRATLETAHIESGFVLSILLGLMLGMSIFLAAGPIAAMFRMEQLAPFVRITSLVFPVVGLSVVAESLLTRALRFKTLAVVELLSYFLGYGVVAILLAFLGYGALALVVGSTTRLCLRTALILYVRPHHIGFRPSWVASKELLYFGGGQTLARIGNFVAVEGDNFVAGRWLGAEALGLYSRAYALAMFPAVVIGSALDRVLFPAMARFQHDPSFLWDWFRRGSVGLAIAMSPVSATAFVLAPEVVEVVLGRDWLAMAVPFQILCLAAPLRASSRISDSVARAMGAVYKRAWRQATYAACVVTAALIGQYWGIAGIALGVLCAITANFLMMTQLSISLVGGSWRSLVASHLPAFVVGMTFAVPTFCLATLLRSMQYSAIVVLVSVAGCSLIGVLAIVALKPRTLLGPDGIWLLASLVKRTSGARAE